MAGDSRGPGGVAEEHASPLENGDDVGPLRHEDNASHGRVQHGKLYTESGFEGPPSDATRATETGLAQELLSYLVGADSEDSVIDVQRGGGIDGVVNEQAVVG